MAVTLPLVSHKPCGMGESGAPWGKRPQPWPLWAGELASTATVTERREEAEACAVRLEEELKVERDLQTSLNGGQQNALGRQLDRTGEQSLDLVCRLAGVR